MAPLALLLLQVTSAQMRITRSAVVPNIIRTMLPQLTSYPSIIGVFSLSEIPASASLLLKREVSVQRAGVSLNTSCTLRRGVNGAG
jgi:hypothetical protein